jgi:nucleoside phosphorylase
MTRTAIIAAMSGELKPLVSGWRHERRNRVDLWRQRYDSGEWVAACAGAGQNAATRALSEIEKDGAVASVLSIGWAGALSESFQPGQAYRVAGVIDTLTGERFRVARVPGSPGAGEPDPVLKGRGFSRATGAPIPGPALAAEGMRNREETLPQGLKPGTFSPTTIGTAKAVPFQNEILLVTADHVADAAEKQRLASTYRAGLVDMEAAAIARLAGMRGISFQCIKGVSDGLDDRLPDFNRFLTREGRFQTASFALFALFHPGYWSALKQMGENSKKASRSIAELVLDILDPQGTIRK